MALLTKVISNSKTLLSIKDYTGAPITTSIGTLVPGSLIFPRHRPRKRTYVAIPSATGETPYAMPDHGLAEPVEVSFDIYATDEKNATDIGPTTLFAALADNLVTATPVSTHVYTNQLSGGGALMAILSVAHADEGGTTHTATANATDWSMEAKDINGVRGYAVKCKIAGAIAWA